MNKWKNVFFLIPFLLWGSCTSEKHQAKTNTDKNGFSYEEITNDPLKTRIYKLDNGLSVYLSQNRDEPRIQTLIGVKAGSSYDPSETTGLAHYFEHMMFKGTDEIATTNWEEEKKQIQKISDLFEEYKNTGEPKTKKAIYAKIDSISQVAAQYTATNEYEKLTSSIGAKGTNAGTSYDFTVYLNDIPSNQLEKWAQIETERFRDIVLRIFHTELETVYEEFNMSQDRDMGRAFDKLMEGLFKKHPYGISVIGLPEHLKNPSMVNIHKFAEKYYAPNNMAIALCGDFEYEEALQIINKHFGTWETKEDPVTQQPVEEPIKQHETYTITGPSAESVMFAYRFEGDNSEDYKYVTLIDHILSNRKAGLIDLNLNQEQKVLKSGANPYFLKDYGIHRFYGTPREGQSLEEVKDLLMGEIEKIKNGEFDDWMIQAVINDLKLREIRSQEYNMSRAFKYIDCFVKDIPYKERLTFFDELEKITKEDLVNFARENYKDNYIIVYKRTGENDTLVKVEKPEITAIPINREAQSDFFKQLTSIETDHIQPVFVDFEETVAKSNTKNGIEVRYIKNPSNEIFNIWYIIDMGKFHNPKLPIAVNYLPYIGTDKYSAAELEKEFFRLGLSMGVYSRDNRSYIYISGLEKNLEKGIELLEHVIAHAKPDKEAYNKYIDGLIKERKNQKLDQYTILWDALFNYGKYGEDNPSTFILPEEELRGIDPGELTSLIKELYSFKHYMFYYGQNSLNDVTLVIDKYHHVPETLKEYPEPKKFEEIEANEPLVYFVDYDMVQANIIMLAKGSAFDKKLIPVSELFGEYFGNGLSSIVFQEIRESKGLAYAAFAGYRQPDRKDGSFFSFAFVATQADKLKTATDAMLGLMNDMPKAEKQFNLAKESILKKIESERITKLNIFYTSLNNMDKGIDYDIRKDVYEKVQNMSIEDLNAFFNEHIAGKNYIFLIIGNKNDLDKNVLSRLGKVKELSLEEIFNY